jgi:four helix bundle protein
MQSHRELVAWQAAREVVLAVFRYADEAWSPGRASLLEQVRRSALSVQLNLAEGYALGRGPRCRNHWRIAYGSAVETTEVLELLLEMDGELGSLVEQSKRVHALTLRLWQRS